ncbi:MAG: 1,4-alpha-glucan branching protein GlgB [Actinobacteria bacterium]|nr:1,4-alpha-glucan branching protein GlgB [Thermoleophilia bacterium]MCB9010489.1 1,4-alpha-glucan branching protein GlgB [Actinomycetota bacterium]
MVDHRHDDAAARLEAGAHHDPHGVLGVHPVVGGGIAVRAWEPGADEVVLIDGSESAVMTRVHPAGLFEAVVDARSGRHHRFRVTRGAHVYETADPYAQLPTVGEMDLHLFGEGRHETLWTMLGAHVREHDGVNGVAFAVWAPNARGVTVVGDWNGWHDNRHPMRSLGASGVWELFIPELAAGVHYKFVVRGADGDTRWRADPMARETEVPPKTASVVAAPTSHPWGDGDWMAGRGRANAHDAPISVYEVHLGSWRQGMGYRELAEALPEYVVEMGFTHVELLPVMEHPFGGSWGYQVSGYYAPTARWGHPDDLRLLVDSLHQAGIGVLLDWVPAHFPRDEWALAEFDGTHLYEHADPRQGAHPDWGTLVFNYGRNEVRNFLVADALYWLEEFHVDGLRVDAVASMLYLDYSRKAGEWAPNEYGGNENLEAISLLQEVNATVYKHHPDIVMVAEESTAWPGVTSATDGGGLGFGLKWNLGFMHDSLDYFSREPVHRKYHHHSLTFPFVYAHSEQYVLPISHDEVVHGKGSLLGKMPGDEWQRFANLRAYLAYMWGHPGKKLLFMGCEIAQDGEWRESQELDWLGLSYAPKAGIQRLVRDLNLTLRAHPALHRRDTTPDGMRVVDADRSEENIVSLMRFADDDAVACIANLSPVPREGFTMGLPSAGEWRELLNTDAVEYGGSGVRNGGPIVAVEPGWNGMPARAQLTLPPLAVVWLTR